MQKKQVAVLDVGSSEIRAYVAERGVNKTFVIKGQKFFSYEGFSDHEFFDQEELKRILLSAGEFLKSVSKLTQVVYVGVPGEFTEVAVRVSQVAFPKRKNITANEVDSLYNSAFLTKSAKKTLINRSAIVYELDDGRRLANPVGFASEILKGKLSFITCENYFIDIFKNTLLASGFTKVEFISNALAQSMYLIDSETRDKVAILADIGYISTTVSVIHGDGIIHQKSFSFGGGYVTASLSERFELSFDDAESLKRKTSITRVFNSSNDELVEGGNGKYYSADDVKKSLCFSLDGLCEEISEVISNLGFNLPEYVSLKITGGGISLLRGAKEYVASRLGMAVEVLTPKVPLMDSPLKSSALSIMDLALEQ